MPYCCESCGNDENFYRENKVTKIGTETEYCDRNGDGVDWGDYNEDDCYSDELGDYICSECNSGDVVYLDTEEEIIELKNEIQEVEEKNKTWKEIITENV